MILKKRFFFFNQPAPTEIYTLSLHDALPISPPRGAKAQEAPAPGTRTVTTNGTVPTLIGDAAAVQRNADGTAEADRKSTRLNSSHSQISYAVFCLKKKNQQK